MCNFLNKSWSSQEFKEFVQSSKDFNYIQGILMKKMDKENVDEVQHAPYTLFPSPIPKKCFEKALSVHVHFNKLMHDVAHDYQFLEECLINVIKVDDFTKRIWDIYETVYKEGRPQKYSLALIRNDFMFHAPQSTSHNKCIEDSNLQKIPNKTVHQYMIDSIPDSVCLKQVEINTISASFAGLAHRLSSYHRHIIGQIDGSCINQVPLNDAVECLADGLLSAFELYNQKNAAILFLISDKERNIYDQRILEYSITTKMPSIKILRRSFKSLDEHLKLNDERKLFIDDIEISIVYQRTCYAPQHFESQKDWDMRLLMERSRSFVCPTTGFHLAGTKKVQQVLCTPGILERFVTDLKVLDELRNTFVGQYSLEMTSEGDKVLNMVIANPNKYVIKPQREGGGNNFYGEEVKLLLKKIEKSDERLNYIIMDLIEPMIIQNYPIVFNDRSSLSKCDMVSELGVFGFIIGSEKDIISNKQNGFLLRTKKVGINEGGVATGFSVLDSPFLVE